MGTDQVLAAAILAAIAILAVVGIWRLTQRRDRSNERDFGAGGRTSVPVGTRGVAETRLAPSGIVRAAGEDWTARAADASPIDQGTAVVVVATDGLTLLVRPVDQPSTTPAASGAADAPPPQG